MVVTDVSQAIITTVIATSIDGLASTDAKTLKVRVPHFYVMC